MVLISSQNKNDDVDLSLLQWVVDALNVAVVGLKNVDGVDARAAQMYVQKATDDINYIISKRLCSSGMRTAAANLNQRPLGF